MVVQNSIGLALAVLLSLPRSPARSVYRTLHLPADHAVGRHHRLHLAAHPVAALGHRRRALSTRRRPRRACSRPGSGWKATALVTISLISVWQFVGIPMMLIYAALLNIPDDLVDAATVDGAGPFSTSSGSCKLPLILPTLGVVAILTFVGNFNAFDLIYTIKGALAGPNFSTDILGTFFYRTFFGYQLQLGSPTMGATVATVMLIIILVGVLVYLFGVQRRLQRHAF